MSRRPIPPSAVAVLEQIKAYTEFESVKISPDGTVEVKFAVKEAERKPQKKEPAPRKSAIDSLAETPPFFDFAKEANGAKAAG